MNGRVVLVDNNELRLTAWMRQQLLLSWCQHLEPRQVEADVIIRLRPPLNVNLRLYAVETKGLEPSTPAVQNVISLTDRCRPVPPSARSCW